jgi:hypothetical protein
MNEKWISDVVFLSMTLAGCFCGLVIALCCYFLGRKKKKHIHYYDLNNPELVFYSEVNKTYTRYTCIKCGHTLTGLSMYDMLHLPDFQKYGCIEIFDNCMNNDKQMKEDEKVIGYKGKNEWDAGVTYMRPPKNFIEGIFNFFHNLFHPYD